MEHPQRFSLPWQVLRELPDRSRFILFCHLFFLLCPGFGEFSPQLFVSGCCPEYLLFLEAVTDQLHTDRQSPAVIPHGRLTAGRPARFTANGVDIASGNICSGSYLNWCDLRGSVGEAGARMQSYFWNSLCQILLDQGLWHAVLSYNRHRSNGTQYERYPEEFFVLLPRRSLPHDSFCTFHAVLSHPGSGSRILHRRNAPGWSLLPHRR